MSEQEDDGSALTFPPLPDPPPPPPHPAARSASAAVLAISAASENLLFTLPPWSPVHPCLDRRTRRRCGVDKYRPSMGRIARRNGVSGATVRAGPKWRNWQTRRTQNPVPFGEWGFDSPLRH